MKKVGIFGGSFNPIHVGHVALAKALREHCQLDEVWLMVSPQNPLKQQTDLIDDRQRYEMAQLALRDVEGVRASDYEFQLPIAESGQGWQIRSKGQVMIYQVLSVGKDPGNAEGYNPATSADVSDLITANDIQFGGKTSGQPCTGAIESTVTFQAPFDILTFIGTASGNEAKLAIQVSTDGNTWTQTDDTIVVANEKRLWSKYVRSYEGNDQVYVRLTQVGGSTGAQCYDIYVMTAGEKSAELKKQMDEEFESVMGIENVVVREVKKTGIYNLNGQRLSAPVKGVNIIDGRKVIIR